MNNFPVTRTLCGIIPETSMSSGAALMNGLRLTKDIFHHLLVVVHGTGSFVAFPSFAQTICDVPFSQEVGKILLALAIGFFIVGWPMIFGLLRKQPKRDGTAQGGRTTTTSIIDEAPRTEKPHGTHRVRSNSSSNSSSNGNSRPRGVSFHSLDEEEKLKRQEEALATAPKLAPSLLRMLFIFSTVNYLIICLQVDYMNNFPVTRTLFGIIPETSISSGAALNSRLPVHPFYRQAYLKAATPPTAPSAFSFLNTLVDRAKNLYPGSNNNNNSSSSNSIWKTTNNHSHPSIFASADEMWLNADFENATSATFTGMDAFFSGLNEQASDLHPVETSV